MTRPTEGKPRGEKRKLAHMVFNNSHILLTAVYKYAWLAHNAVGLSLTYVTAMAAKDEFALFQTLLLLFNFIKFV